MTVKTPECPSCGETIRAAAFATWRCDYCDAVGTIDKMGHASSLTRTYFTFGQDHVFPNGETAAGHYVEVTCYPEQDPRVLFMAWLGSNKFASEYSQVEWEHGRMLDTYYNNEPPYAMISVSEFHREER